MPLDYYSSFTAVSVCRDAIDAGLRPTNHTDFVVAPLDQMMMLWSAVNRISRAGAEVGPDQRVTPYESLKAMTEWAEEEYDEQASKGTLQAGKLADLVILDNAPLKVDPMAIKDIKVLETIKEGKTIYPAAAGAQKPLHAELPKSTKTYAWRAEVCDMTDVNQAANKEWTLTTLNGNKILAKKPPTMKFANEQLLFSVVLTASREAMPWSTTASPLVR